MTKSTAYKAGAAYARVKSKLFRPRRLDMFTPMGFAIGGVVGFFAFTMLAAISDLLASLGLALLIGALAWELLKKP